MKTVSSPEPNGLLAGALALAGHGLRVLPNRPRQKQPIDKDWPNLATTDPETIRGWWKRHPDANPGVLTGDDVFVLDVDGAEGQISKEILEEEHGRLPPTWEVKTPGGNGDRQHSYYRTPPGVVVRNSAGKLGKRLDVRGAGGQVVAPPSVHPNGNPYIWAAGHAPDDLPLALAPAWLVELVRERPTARAPRPTNGAGEFPPGYAAAALKDELAKLQTAPAGTGNHQLNNSAHAVGQLVGAGELDADEVHHQLQETAVERKIHLYGKCTAAEEREIDATIESGLTAGMADPRAAPPESLHFNDADNAERFVAQHGEDVRFCHGPDRWYGWDGRRWREDRTGRVHRLARRTAKTIFREATEAFGSTNEHVQKRWKKVQAWAVRSGFEARLRAMVSLARSWDGVAVTPDQLDDKPWLLNCRNGTLNLRTGELREARRADLITKMVPVAYDPAAKCPRFDEFLKRIMRGNPELIAYLQRLIGYLLTGLTSERQFTIFYGRGDNGKTTLSELILALLGDYGQTAEISTFLEQRSDKVRDDLADLVGARVVVGMEVPENRQLAESLLKQLTGGEDRIKTRHLFKRYFTYRPNFKVLMTANHKPVIRGTDNAIWNRVHLLPFDVEIPKEDQDPKLLAKLRRELPGVLAWAVRGCREWQRRGLDPPREVLAATADYRVEMDKTGAFLADRCVERLDARVGVSELHADYVEWCGGDHPLGRNNFGQRLKERGFRQEKKGAWRWVGLRLLARGVGEDRDEL